MKSLDPEPSPGPSTADSASFGVAEVDWPNDLDSARPMFAALPERLVDVGRGERFTGRRSLGAFYGEGEAVTVEVQTVPGADDPPSALAELASWSMCDRDTRRGTAPLQGLTTATRANDVWFSCQVARDADSESPGAQVLGWTSGQVLWLVEAPDRQSVSALVAPMVAAAAAVPGDGPGRQKPSTTAPVPYALGSVDWPAAIDEVMGKLAQLPEADGQAPKLFAEAGDVAGAEYPDGDVVMVLRGSQGLDASAMLAAGFGLSMGCARGTFQGTARGIPGGRPEKAPADAEVRWFSCGVNGAEGDPRFRGHVIGWTHEDLAWLVTGTSKARAEQLVKALVGATR